MQEGEGRSKLASYQMLQFQPAQSNKRRWPVRARCNPQAAPRRHARTGHVCSLADDDAALALLPARRHRLPILRFLARMLDSSCT